MDIYVKIQILILYFSACVFLRLFKKIFIEIKKFIVPIVHLEFFELLCHISTLSNGVCNNILFKILLCTLLQKSLKINILSLKSRRSLQMLMLNTVKDTVSPVIHVVIPQNPRKNNRKIIFMGKNPLLQIKKMVLAKEKSHAC